MKFYNPAIIVTAALFLASCSGPAPEPVVVNLQSKQWNFTTDRQPSELSLPANPTDGFTLKFTLDFFNPESDVTILEIPQVLEVKLKQHNPSEWDGQNYSAKCLEDGLNPVIEAALWLKSDLKGEVIRPLIIGAPLAMLNNPFSKHEVVLHFNDVSWSMYIDGEMVDTNFAIGYPDAPSLSLNSDSAVISDIAYFTPFLRPENVPSNDTFKNIQYFMPNYYNAWVGDVATYWYQGRYHVFYLLDRRHHTSKFGTGGHYFEHLSTADFHTWTEHEAATPITAQWITFGTGNAFEYNGQLCIGYGYHTSRIYNGSATTYQNIRDEVESKGCFTPRRETEFGGLVPEGASYAVSQNGVNEFVPSGILFHYCENPSLFRTPDGKYMMYANAMSRGTWTADDLNSDWSCVDADFPPGGDCTFPLSWNGYDYIIGGFVNVWFKKSEETEFRDMTKGVNLYDGLSVPCLTKLPDGRVLSAGWTNNTGWGGNLIIHEVVQQPDGCLTTKWFDEITPKTSKPVKLAGNATTCQLDRNHSYIVTFEIPVKPSGVASLALKSATASGDILEWSLDVDAKKAQYARFKEGTQRPVIGVLSEGFHPNDIRDYAVCGGFGDGKTIKVRMYIHNSCKLNGSLIDTEIDANRAMVDYQPLIKVDSIDFGASDIEITNVTVAEVIE